MIWWAVAALVAYGVAQRVKRDQDRGTVHPDPPRPRKQKLRGQRAGDRKAELWMWNNGATDEEPYTVKVATREGLGWSAWVHHRYPNLTQAEAAYVYWLAEGEIS